MKRFLFIHNASLSMSLCNGSVVKTTPDTIVENENFIYQTFNGCHDEHICKPTAQNEPWNDFVHGATHT